MSAPDWRDMIARVLHASFHADTIAGKMGDTADEAWERGCATDDDQYWRSQADAVLDAIKAAGFVIVPREPTGQMIEAGIDVWCNFPGSDEDQVKEHWAAVLAASCEPREEPL